MDSASTRDVVVGEDGLARPRWASADPMMREYYDTEWGMPVRGEQKVGRSLTFQTSAASQFDHGNTLWCSAVFQVK